MSTIAGIQKKLQTEVNRFPEVAVLDCLWWMERKK